MTARLTADQRRLREITEAQWQSTVEEIARLCGWLVYHAPDNRPVLSGRGTRYVQNVRAGFPDLVLVRRDRLVFAELKRETGRLSDDQHCWLQALEDAKAEVFVWYPSDLQRVREVLQ